ncbi:MAG: hypothetical protein HN560_08940 [Anaerolineae bacterium]|jgi:hypothetical protein|nr:hypothetical protein [Anaerolineae bacterium]MBT7601186.1 hypothetical protein [Anaerolineae bacterium]MBT7991348.1 hypothetical protein [Anaerolineae bacterium]
MTRAFEENIPKHFSFLIDKFDFSLISLSSTSAIFSSKICTIKVIQDRYQVSIDVGPNSTPAKWFDLGVITAYLTKQTGAGEWVYEIPRGMTVSKAIEQQISKLANILEEYIPQIIPLFREKVFLHIEQDLTAFWKKRTEAFLKNQA